MGTGGHVLFTLSPYNVNLVGYTQAYPHYISTTVDKLGMNSISVTKCDYRGV
jgi:hypothetical protein